MAQRGALAALPGRLELDRAARLRRDHPVYHRYYDDPEPDARPAFTAPVPAASVRWRTQTPAG